MELYSLCPFRALTSYSENIPDYLQVTPSMKKCINKDQVRYQISWINDCLGTHLHRIGIRPDPYSMLCSLHKTMDRNHIRRCTALSSGTECERYWEARTKMMENRLFPFHFCDYYSLLGALCLFWMFLMFLSFLLSVVFIMELLIFCFYWSHRSLINNQCTCH